MTPVRAAPLALLIFATPAAADFDGFRQCADGQAAASVTGTYNACIAPLVVHCAASATAAEAATCIDAVRAGMEQEIEAQVARLTAADASVAEGVDETLAANRAVGEASCGVLAQRDASSGVAVGQRAVNAAFCQLVISGDVLGMAYRLENGE